MKAVRGSAAILVNSYKDDAERLSHEMHERLKTLGWNTKFITFGQSKAIVSPLEGSDILISLGGDGTVLYAARSAAPLGVPILPIDLGTLGFIAWVKREEWEARFEEAVSGRLAISERFMLDVVVEREGKAIAAFSGLNDGVVSGSGPAKIVALAISVNGATIGRYRSDGLIVSTPTGSTAYSLAAGGPVLDPDMDAMVLTPVCPFTLSNRPLVMPGGETLAIHVESGQRERTMLTVDGQDFFDLIEGDRIVFKRSGYRARLYRRERDAFFQVLRTKLNWSGGPDA
ncbi:NAD(+)/NADH kinase [Spirochaetota bacterium]